MGPSTTILPAVETCRRSACTRNTGPDPDIASQIVSIRFDFASPHLRQNAEKLSRPGEESVAAVQGRSVPPRPCGQRGKHGGRWAPRNSIHPLRGQWTTGKGEAKPKAILLEGGRGRKRLGVSAYVFVAPFRVPPPRKRRGFCFLLPKPHSTSCAVDIFPSSFFSLSDAQQHNDHGCTDQILIVSVFVHTDGCMCAYVGVCDCTVFKHTPR